FAQCLYFLTLFSIRQYTRLSFYPSFAAFTFPLVISATALTRFIAIFASKGLVHNLLSVLQWGEWLVASLMLIFVTGHYLNFLRLTAKTVKQAAATQEVSD
ncbi:tellurium resistance protein, partial [Acinetobacter baumannii]|nr:tellurium resistance protein [Acinetobacter baumannii]